MRLGPALKTLNVVGVVSNESVNPNESKKCLKQFKIVRTIVSKTLRFFRPRTVENRAGRFVLFPCKMRRLGVTPFAPSRTFPYKRYALLSRRFVLTAFKFRSRSLVHKVLIKFTLRRQSGTGKTSTRIFLFVIVQLCMRASL